MAPALRRAILGGVQRSPALAPLSRDHHVTLTHAQRLRRARDPDVAVVVASFLAFFVGEGERHFRAEEQVLLPLLRANAERAGRRLSAEHAEIRRRARALGERPQGDAAAQLGELLAAHVRFEERELFPLLEARLEPETLADVARRLDAEGAPAA
jgi:hemerythrin-like domain-containing protein